MLLHAPPHFGHINLKFHAIKQSEVEPDMPKMGRRGDFSHFCPCRALARLRTQKQKFIHADTVLGAGSLKQTDFCVGKA